MKNIIFIYAAFNIDYPFVKAFGKNAPLSAFEKVIDWATNVPECEGIFVATNSFCNEKINAVIKEKLGEQGSFSDGKKILVLEKESWNTYELLKTMAEQCSTSSVPTALFSFGDTPFMNGKLTEEILESHRQYVAEYSFQDGYPDGFAPEAIDSGALNILANLAGANPGLGKDAPVTEKSIFNVINKDINSFDIETVMAPKDYRLLRLDFSTSTKAGFISCKKLQELSDQTFSSQSEITVEKLSDLAEKNVSVQKTVPSFYNVQIESACSTYVPYNPYSTLFQKKYGYEPSPNSEAKKLIMSKEDFSSLVEKISAFSEDAVVSVSAFGECLLNDDFSAYAKTVLAKKNLSLLVETDGLALTEKVCQEVKASLDESPCGFKNFPKIMWIVNLDAVTLNMYNSIHTVADSSVVAEGKTAFQTVQENLVLLAKYFDGMIYPQFTRMNVNEVELESFYRLWHDGASLSKGKLIVQKYSTFCGILADEKPADLSPVTRNPCWHLKRDMTVLFDGTVPLCREQPFTTNLGNALSQPLEEIWAKSDEFVQQHIESCIGKECGKCDEYYTFNF